MYQFVHFRQDFSVHEVVSGEVVGFVLQPQGVVPFVQRMVQPEFQAGILPHRISQISCNQNLALYGIFLNIKIVFTTNCDFFTQKELLRKLLLAF